MNSDNNIKPVNMRDNEAVNQRICAVAVKDIMKEDRPAVIYIRKKTFECSYCQKTFKLKFYLNQHRLVHNEEIRPYSCNVCGKRYARRQSMYDHRRWHCIRRQFECPVCKKLFKTVMSAKVHQRIHKKNRTADFYCNECGKSFFSKGSLKTHQIIHSNPAPFKCESCDMKFKLKYTFKMHQLTHRSVGEKSFSCKTCDKKFFTYVTMRRHSLLHKKKPFACRKCPKTFFLLIHLERHKLLHKNDDGKDTRPFICDICGKGYAKRFILNAHKQIHSEGRQFECLVCKNSFKTEKTMKAHQKIHEKNRTADFHCKECGKSVLTKASLRAHQLLHLNRKSFKCGFCDREFKSQYTMIRHENKHNTVSEKSFSCHICDKKYLTYNKMLKHSFLHKEKSFACKQCPRVFTYLIQLERHELWHNNGSDKNAAYVCKTCVKTFSSESNLENHQRICKKDSTINPSYSCPICGKIFATKGYLPHHISRVHNATEVKREDQLDIYKNTKLADFDLGNCQTNSEAINLSSTSPTTSESVFTNSTIRVSMISNVALPKYPADDYSTTSDGFVNELTASNFVRLNSNAINSTSSSFTSHADVTTVSTLDSVHSDIKSNQRNRLNEDYWCSLCGELFPNEQILNIHHRLCKKESSIDPNYSCPICGKVFTTKGYLPHHISRVHNKNTKLVNFDHINHQTNFEASKLSSISPTTSESVFINKTVSVSMVSNVVIPNYTAHDYSITSDAFVNKLTASNFIQQRLNKSVANSSYSSFLPSHADVTTVSTLDSVHSDIKSNQPNRVKEVYWCSLCGESFDSKQILQTHMVDHTALATPATTYCCVECCIEFATQFRLDDHNHQFHDRVSNSYGCLICKVVFTTKEQLFKHGQEKHRAKYWAAITPI